jgi:uncharacterized protein (TIRG00374 family)
VKRIGLALKVAFVVALLWFLGRKGFISLHATRRAFTHADRMVPAIAAMIAAMLLGVLRWHWLLRGHGIVLPATRTLTFALIGNFFNLALPGAVSGDVVKAFYIARERPGRRGDALATIVFDRVAGLAGLVLLAATALLLELDAVRGTKLLAAIQVFMAVAAAMVVLFFAHLFLVSARRDPLLRLLRALERRVPRARSATTLYQSLRHYHRHPRLVMVALAMSVLLHCLVCFAFLDFWRALEPVRAPILSLFVVVPLGLLVTAVPVAPAGMGTGHAAFGALFLLLGSKTGANVFSVFVVVQLALAGVGGLVYLGFRVHGADDVPRAPDVRSA